MHLTSVYFEAVVFQWLNFIGFSYFHTTKSFLKNLIFLIMTETHGYGRKYVGKP